ncbi:pentatricopeptide repeat-containing protein At1g73710-like [Chenopodium quinoa]|uniref:pentatricopeptide repeat-containing protein At1g73710-like n=1 Tax=Chenopodium quinoa TaxID=63459 RepID=UPI000B76F4E7|nr:pentatricopeptide repeat-containing protein At1g73710-like [Chenopodium quinoa]
MLGLNYDIRPQLPWPRAAAPPALYRGRAWFLSGFKLNCVSNALVSHLKTSKFVNGKKKKYGGTLPSVLRSLDSEQDSEKTLNLYVGKLSPKELTVILKEQSSWERVLKIFDWIRLQKDYVPNVIHYNVVLRMLGRAQRWDELRHCWIEMARDGVMPTNNTYSMLIDVYGKAGLVEESLLWIKHMRVRDVYPDEVTMSTIVKVLKDAGEFDRADRFYKDWCDGKIEFQGLDLDDLNDIQSQSKLKSLSLKHFLSTELFKIGGRYSPAKGENFEMENTVRKPQLTATYNTMIDLYSKAGRLDDAAGVFSEMLKSGVAPDTITFNTLIHTCGSHGHLSEAEALFEKMEERGTKPDTKTYNTLLSLHAQAGNVVAALQWYHKIRKVDLFPDAVTQRAVLHMLCERQMVKEAEVVISEIERFKKHIDEHSIPGIVKMYVNQGLLEQARTFFEKCLVDGGLSSKTYAAIMDVYAEIGMCAEAEDIFYAKRDVKGAKKDVSEYNVLIKAFGKAKLYEKAFSVFKSMRNYGTWPDECTYNSMIQMFAGGDLLDQAKEVLIQMQEAGLKPHVQTFSAVIACYARLGLLSDAISTFQEMINDGLKPNEVVYGVLINGFAEAGRTKEALYYYRMMRGDGISENQIILTSLIKAYSKGGYLKGAKETYESLKRLEGGPDIVASNSMISLYADLGIVSEAKAIFDNVRLKGQADGITFALIMNLYKNMGMLDEASEVAEEMKRAGLVTDCASYTKVMACYATNGQLADCGELLYEMVTRKFLPEASTFKVLFTILKKGGMPSEAIQQLEASYQEGKPWASQAVIACVFSVVGLHSFTIEFCEAFTEAINLDSFAYNAAIYAYAACGNTDKALNLFMRMQDEGFRPDVVTYINLVNCYGKSNMVEGVRRIYGQLKYQEIEVNESLVNAIVNAYKNANRPDLAELVSQEMKFGFDMNSESEFELYYEDET